MTTACPYSAPPSSSSSFCFNRTAATEIYTLSLHDALPICQRGHVDDHIRLEAARIVQGVAQHQSAFGVGDRKSTRLNSSHVEISYAVFCLKKKNISVACRLLDPRACSDRRRTRQRRI